MVNALLFGSIGVIAETSNLQREAFNAAFEEAGLDWHWETDEYRRMLQSSGGRDRIANYAKDRGQDVDAAAIHARKSELFQNALSKGISPRSGVTEVIAAAHDNDVPLGLVTTTSAENVRQVLDATDIPAENFTFIGHRDLVRIGKPSAEIYRLALQQIGVKPSETVAIEDSATSARAALAADIPVVAFPGAFHSGDDFGDVKTRVDRLAPGLFGLNDDKRAVA